ncbi:MAG: LytTR family transcriptional regulator DNA-binding domain-containing protein [Marinilabiliaceae bacterium]|nr:LytTR family transcriptional regulator DNA-binding domain-containing protein [Marinilabiliaceae bacterium]
MKRIVLNTQRSYYLVKTDDIIYCKSNNSYTTFYFVNQQPVTVTNSIKYYSQLLTDTFIRPHQSYLVNINQIESVRKKGDVILTLKSGDEIPVSNRKKKEVIQIILKMLHFQM